MDALCDTLLLEEILPRLPPKPLLRLGATSRRYNALAHRPDFASRYWHRAGVIFQPFDQPKEVTPRFLTAAQDHAAFALPGADLAFLPGPSAHEAANLRRAGDDPDGGFAVLHSAGGLLLCSRGRTRALHLYVCNPVTGQWVALPEVPLPVCKRHCAHLTVSGGGADDNGAMVAFKVVLANHASHWTGPRGGQLDLRVFASDTGRWEARRFPATVIAGDVDLDYFNFRLPPMLGPSGTSYRMSYGSNLVVAFNGSAASASDDSLLRVITLPYYVCLVGGGERNLCIGERHGGGLRYVESNRRVLQVWDAPQGSGGHRHGVSSWTLVHRVGAAELVERNPGAAAFLRYKNPSTWDHQHLKPVGVHPTDDDIIFVALPGAVVAYSIEHGTVSLGCRNDDGFVTAADTFPYVHPPFPLQIPAIKTSTLTLPDNGGSPTFLASETEGARKRRKIFTEPHGRF
ncbi:unnamed protein product [Urochloa decumbens]|uniref:F-box protein At3g26010-like beta-propeller domain-containing protein n=1 Tax=Urochloa decumbens TaxID=240449 RepID=A0ABC8Z823_9POAL